MAEEDFPAVGLSVLCGIVAYSPLMYCKGSRRGGKPPWVIIPMRERKASREDYPER